MIFKKKNLSKNPFNSSELIDKLGYSKDNTLVLDINESNDIIFNEINLLSTNNYRYNNLLIICSSISDIEKLKRLLDLDCFVNKSIYLSNIKELSELSTSGIFKDREFNIIFLNEKNIILENSNEINFLKSRLGELEGLVNYYNYSLSWKLTKPLRYLNNSVKNRTTIKSFLKKIPFILGFYRFTLHKLNNFERNILEKTISEQNIKHTNYISSQRLAYSLKENKKSFKDIINDNKTSYPSINISVVTHNNGKWLKTFFESLIKQDYPLNKIKLFFVDNSSTDDTYAELIKYKDTYSDKFLEIIVIQTENKGFGYGHDCAIQKMDSNYVLISNIDLEFRKDTLTNLIKFVQNDTDKDQVACYELVQHPYEHPKYYDPITLETAWCSHACVLINIEKYKAVGGYHKKIFMYGEDVELSYRFRAYGYKLKYVPISIVNHYTYDEINKVKPLQFIGSTKANMLLRISYGNKIDKLYGYLLQLGLIFRGGVIKDSRKHLIRNFFNIIKDKSYFSNIQKVKDAYFPFRGFDYEMSRKGAFYDLIKERSECSKSQPLVSIITRTYKGREKFLNECIASVLNQTYTNIEHIIVEDGGDTMKDTIHKIREKNPNNIIQYYPLPKKGRSYIGNQGVLKAKGKYCLFLDDDDLIFPDHIDVLVNSMLKNDRVKATYSLAWEVLTTIKDDGSYYEHEYLFNQIFEQEFDRDILLKYNYIPIQCILFSKELFDKYGGFDEEMDQLEDWNLWTKYALVSDFKFVNKLTSLYRTPFDITIRNKRAAKLDEAYKTAIDKQNELLRKLRKS